MTYGEEQWPYTWKYSYQGIRQAAIFIQNVDMCNELTSEERADYKAQARFVRAYYYWKLLQKYGPVPIVPEEGQDYTDSYEALSIPRNTYDECADYIASEMALAAKDLPLKRELMSVSRPTRGAALAVRAKALLYAASPLMNGNTDGYAEKLVDDKGNRLLAAAYDEKKWARAAAAAKDPSRNAALGAGCDAYMCTGANVFGCSRKKNQAGAEGSSDVFFRELQFALSQNRTRKKIQRRTAFRCCERCKGFFRRVFCMISPHLMQAAVDKLAHRAQACILF